MNYLERMLINKGHYLDDLYWVCILIEGLIDSLIDDLQDILNECEDNDTYGLIESVITQIIEFKHEFVEGVDEIC